MSNDPLSRVHLQGVPAAPGGPAASAAAVQSFNAAVGEVAASRPVDPLMASEEKKEEIPVPHLDEAELAAMAQFRALLDANQFHTADLAGAVQDLQRLRDRNAQIEKRLAPLKLSSLLLEDFLKQVVPISPETGTPGDPDYDPGYSLTYRTIAASVEIDAEEVARALASEWKEAGKTNVTETFLLNVATLVCGLSAVAGAPQAADAIARMACSNEEERNLRRQYILAETRRFLEKPIPLLQEMADHQRLFTTRVRKTIQHHGYVEQELGK